MRIVNLARRIDPLADDEFDRLFERFQHTAFRLETLQHYSMPYEDKLLRRFLAGESKPAELNAKYAWWYRVIADAIAAGKHVERIHVVAEPHSDYMRFQLAWLYPGNAVAGEDIRIIPTSSGRWPADLPGYGHDYWLLDSQTMALLHYDHEGRFVAVDLTDNESQIAQANAWRDAALHQAISYKEYMGSLKLRAEDHLVGDD
jgi:hypothetical protein